MSGTRTPSAVNVMLSVRVTIPMSTSGCTDAPPVSARSRPESVMSVPPDLGGLACAEFADAGVDPVADCDGRIVSRPLRQLDEGLLTPTESATREAGHIQPMPLGDAPQPGVAQAVKQSTQPGRDEEQHQKDTDAARKELPSRARDDGVHNGQIE